MQCMSRIQRRGSFFLAHGPKTISEGGDIDLLVISDQLDFRKQWKIRRDILDEIGWQKLDLLVCPADQLNSGIARLAIESGVSL